MLDSPILDSTLESVLDSRLDTQFEATLHSTFDSVRFDLVRFVSTPDRLHSLRLSVRFSIRLSTPDSVLDSIPNTIRLALTRLDSARFGSVGLKSIRHGVLQFDSITRFDFI